MASESVDVCLELGALQSWVGVAMFNAAEALFLAGRWDDCQQVLGGLHEQRCGGSMERLELVFTALFAASRGRDEAAGVAIAAAESVGGYDTQADAMLSAARAQLALNTGDLDAAHQAVVEGVDTLTGSSSFPEVIAVVTLAGLGLRIDADRAVVAHAHRDLAGEQAAVHSARTIAERTLAVRARACPVARRPEVLRAHRRSVTRRWAGQRDARTPISGHRSPPPERAIGIRTAPRTLDCAKPKPCRRAGATAPERSTCSPPPTSPPSSSRPSRSAMRSKPSHAEPASSYAEPQPSMGPLPPDPGLPPLGLTVRELDVLRLLAAGCTNPQIGEALYISRKTASHHVSSILTKLGVTTRVEAAGVAHRLDLTPDTTAAK